MTKTPSVFNYTQENFILSSTDGNCGKQQIKQKLLSAWDIAQTKDVFNYKLDSCKAKFRLVDGKYLLSIQLNTERCKNRRKPKKFSDICQTFDSESWNFTKLKPDECLFSLNRLDGPKNNKIDEKSIIAVNASPISPGHFLVIPSPTKCFPQVLTEQAVRCALELILLVNDSKFVLFFNSLLAYASINHLHLQAIFWPYESGLVRAKCSLVDSATFAIIRRPEWRIEKAAKFLVGKNLAHSLFFARAPKINGKIDEQMVKDDNGRLPPQLRLPTMYLFPRERTYESADPDCRTFVPAAFELAGLIPVYDLDFFDTVTEDKLLHIFDKHALLSDDLFEELASQLNDYLCN